MMAWKRGKGSRSLSVLIYIGGRDMKSGLKTKDSRGRAELQKRGRRPLV